jgi:hypothetical protein
MVGSMNYQNRLRRGDELVTTGLKTRLYIVDEIEEIEPTSRYVRTAKSILSAQQLY